MRGRPTREGIGDRNLAVRVTMDEILARERLERAVGFEPELLGGRAQLHAGGAAASCETAQDPEVELALRLGEPGASRRAELRGRDLGRRQRRGHARRQLARVRVLGVDAHFAASISASRTQLSSGRSEVPSSLR
jgi:hypothetical protein